MFRPINPSISGRFTLQNGSWRYRPSEGPLKVLQDLHRNELSWTSRLSPGNPTSPCSSYTSSPTRRISSPSSSPIRASTLIQCAPGPLSRCGGCKFCGHPRTRRIFHEARIRGQKCLLARHIRFVWGLICCLVILRSVRFCSLEGVGYGCLCSPNSVISPLGHYAALTGVYRANSFIFYYQKKGEKKKKTPPQGNPHKKHSCSSHKETLRTPH